MLNDEVLHAIEQVIAADDTGQIACKLLIEYQKLKHDQYSGHTLAIIDKLRLCDEQIVLKVLDVMKGKYNAE